MLLLKLVTNVALVGLGYYVGREVGRMETIREELARAREAKAGETAESQTTHQTHPDDSRAR